MRIGILGAGHIGGTLGQRWAKQGHAVFYGVRDMQSEHVKALVAQPDFASQIGSINEAVAFGDVVLLAVPGEVVTDLVASIPDWKNKIVIDATNAITGPVVGYHSLGEAVAAHAPTARVVKAFNTAGYEIYADAQFGSQAADLFLCGDDADARQVVAGLSSELGLVPRNMGNLSNARLLESLAMTWIYLAILGGEMDRNIAIKILER